jgi:hypothetical protein
MRFQVREAVLHFLDGGCSFAIHQSYVLRLDHWFLGAPINYDENRMWRLLTLKLRVLVSRPTYQYVNFKPRVSVSRSLHEATARTLQNISLKTGDHS